MSLPRYVQLIRESSAVKALEPLPVQLPPEWESLVANSLPKKIKTVLFDVYGTLFISGAGDIGVAHTNSNTIGNTADETGTTGELAEMQDFFRRMVNHYHEKAKTAGIACPEVLADTIWAHYRGKLPPLWEKTRHGREIALRYELAVNPVYPMPGALETIHALTAQSITLGIISNAQFYTPLLFNAFFNCSPRALGFDPSLLIYSYKEREAKPSSRLFEKAKKRLAKKKIAPEETLYVGNDILNDIEPAAKEGFITALFAGDRRSLRIRDKKTTPDFIIKDLQALVHNR